MMISRLKSLGAVGGLVVGLVLGTALATVFSAIPPIMAQGPVPAAALALGAREQQGANKALAADQLKMAHQALEELEALYKDARLDMLDSRVAVWERRQIEALQASGIGKAELVSALETYVKRMKDLSLVAETRREQARIIHPDVLDWQFRALEGEMWLNQAKRTLWDADERAPRGLSDGASRVLRAPVSRVKSNPVGLDGSALIASLCFPTVSMRIKARLC